MNNWFAKIVDNNSFENAWKREEARFGNGVDFEPRGMCGRVNFHRDRNAGDTIDLAIIFVGWRRLDATPIRWIFRWNSFLFRESDTKASTMGSETTIFHIRREKKKYRFDQFGEDFREFGNGLVEAGFDLSKFEREFFDSWKRIFLKIQY